VHYMSMFAKVRRLFHRDHLSISEIQRRTSLSRNTIKAWLKESNPDNYKYPKRPQENSKLTPYIPALLLALKVDVQRSKRDRRTGLMLFETIKKEGYTGSYSLLTRYIRQWRNDSMIASKSAYVPLKFELGEAFQFDWSEEWLMIGGIHRKIQVAHTKLCASRAFFLSAYPTQTQEMLYDAHTRAFTALGGIPKRGIYDNMKTAVDKVIRKSNGRVINSRFYAMTAHYLFEPDFCNVASGWEKGIIEKNVQDARRRVWIEAKTQCFSTFEELNAWLDLRCRALWTEIEHPDYAGITVADALEQEQIYLMPMPAPFDGYIEILARVSSTCLVTVERNQYSVPCHLANSKVTIRLYANQIDICTENDIVARHARLLSRDQVSYDWQHYIPLIEKKPGALRNGAPFADMPLIFAQLRTALRQRERQQGDRIMAKVLAAVPVHGLETVLGAVKQLLDSGVTSLEQVVNVLSRLNEPPAPAQVVTGLTLTEEPLADTARYDRLNEQEVAHV
jgi:transposase